eukprot:1056965-Pleurochrysis_carterae.AAC.1
MGRCVRRKAARACAMRCGDGTVCAHASCVRTHGALRRWDASCARGLRAHARCAAATGRRARTRAACARTARCGDGML